MSIARKSYKKSNASSMKQSSSMSVKSHGVSISKRDMYKAVHKAYGKALKSSKSCAIG